MGVVTDKSLQGLTTAVQGISASGMSDTTGQAIVSAINGLSGAISPAASNVTFDNTGTGLSASNVQVAIAELDNVKADNTQIINTYKAATVAYSSGWIDDFFNIDMSVTTATRSFFIAYNANTTTFGFLQKRKSDGKIMSTISWSINDNIYISGVL